MNVQINSILVRILPIEMRLYMFFETNFSNLQTQ